MKNSELMMLIHPVGKGEQFRKMNAEDFNYPSVFFEMDRGKSVGCRFLFNNMISMLSDPGKVGVKNDY